MANVRGSPAADATCIINETNRAIFITGAATLVEVPAYGGTKKDMWMQNPRHLTLYLYLSYTITQFTIEFRICTMEAIRTTHAEEHQYRTGMNSERVSNLYLHLSLKMKHSRMLLIRLYLFLIAEYTLAEHTYDNKSACQDYLKRF